MRLRDECHNPTAILLKWIIRLGRRDGDGWTEVLEA